MDIKIIQFSKDYLNILFLAGRGCYGLKKICSETKEIKQKFIKKLIFNHHESVLEHCYISIQILNCSRSFMAQITRHRLVSFSIKSQHYTKHLDFNYKDLEIDNFLIKNDYISLMRIIKEHYNKFVEYYKIPIHIAREILPNSCLTNIIMTTNLREWRYIIKLRQTPENTLEMIKFIKLIKPLFIKIIPEVFDDL